MGGNAVPAEPDTTPAPASPVSPAAAGMTTVSASVAPLSGSALVPAQSTPVPKIEGVDSYNAERVARQSACNVENTAALISKGPGFETYSVKCGGGDALVVRCEFGNCRILK